LIEFEEKRIRGNCKMPLPETSVVIKSLIARTLVGSALLYLVGSSYQSDGLSSDVMSALIVSGGSIISEAYLEQPGMMLGPMV
jgi:hypothetical protein